MATEPILTIEIDDSAFVAFTKRFEDHQRALAETSARWQEVSKAVTGTSRALGRTGGALSAYSARAKAITVAAARDVAAVDSVAEKWRAIGHGGASLAGHLISVTAKIVRWSVLGGAVAGLLGAGSLLGLGRLAESLSSDRTKALGLGMSTGQVASFTTAFRRIGADEDVLEGLTGAVQDPRKRAGLVSMGVDPTGKGASDIFVELLPKIKALADRSDPRALEQTARAYGLPEYGIDGGTLQILRSMSPAEVAAMIASYRKGAAPMGLDDASLRKWADLNQTLEEAAGTISGAFRRGLVALTGPIARISTEAERVIVGALRQGGPVDDAIKAASDGIDWLAGHINSPAFQAAVGDFLKHAAESLRLAEALFNLKVLAGGFMGGMLGAIAGGLIGGPLGAAAGAIVGGGIGAYKAATETAPAASRGWTGAENKRVKDLMGQGKGFGEAAKTVADERGTASDSGSVPNSVLDGALSLLQKGGNSADLQRYMADAGYPKSGAWCGQFTASVVSHAGGTPPKGAGIASNWMRWGQHVDPKDVQTGDVAVKLRSRFRGGGPVTPGQTGSHVGLVAAPPNDGKFQLIGGNQSRPITPRRTDEFEFRRGIDKVMPTGDTFKPRTDRRDSDSSRRSIMNPQSSRAAKPLSVFVQGDDSHLVTVMSKGRGALSR